MRRKRRNGMETTSIYMQYATNYGSMQNTFRNLLDMKPLPSYSLGHLCY